ncbi:MAG TPA: transcriptional regulator [Blastocatellia bacterium]|jgi:DNA-binding winged helix-turn-helix (wHTH) protein|nr:transcriptional regulator [Blastocatellia bacterium]
MSDDGGNNGSGAPEGDFRISEWLVQPELNRLVRGGEVSQVQPKIMGVLVCLAERPGRVVSKERLFKTVWAGTHVTEHVLSRSISDLRKVLNDDSRNPHIIETIPRSGYRLIAPVSREPQGSEEREGDGSLPPSVEFKGRYGTDDGPDLTQGAERSAKSYADVLFALAALTSAIALLIFILSTLSRHPHH